MTRAIMTGAISDVIAVCTVGAISCATAGADRPSATQSTSTAQEAKVNQAAKPEETIHRFAKYVRERDLNNLLSLYEPNAVFIPGPGAQVTGREAFQAAFREMFALKPVLDVVPAEVHRSGDLAFVANDWMLNGTAPDGTPVHKTGRSAVVLRRNVNGEWLIAIDRP
jgi:uncharacterized protein (TIGR02246 family)